MNAVARYLKANRIDRVEQLLARFTSYLVGARDFLLAIEPVQLRMVGARIDRTCNTCETICAMRSLVALSSLAISS